MFRKMLMATLALGGAALAAPAGAAPISFSSDGRFETILDCNPGATGASACKITEGGNLLSMSGGNASTLAANDFGPVTVEANANDVTIAQLTWVNRASGNASHPTDPDFTVTYVLTLAFGQPNADIASQAFTLNIRQPDNIADDVASGFQVTSLASSFQLTDLVVSDLRFTASGAGSFENGVWRNPEGGTSVLRLTADFTAVPEPASLALFSAALLGLAAVRRRRRTTAR